MPAKNTIKQYAENGYYHLYNRGVEKRMTFLDSQDYAIFLSYLKEYLLPKDGKGLRQKLNDPNTSYKEKANIIKILRLNNFYNEIKLIAYCLMPNHFHFFVKQKDKQSIHKFMQSFSTRYTMYFNKKYKRVGSLFQAVYKAVLVSQEQQFIYLTKYIHKQALASKGETFQGQPSSYPEYLGLRNTKWIQPEEVLSYFSEINPRLSYKSFVENVSDDYEIIKNVTIEE
ncbi:MAG: transposase [Candidatus Levybacteria bacterium]|nr:transposase [Candidatus Levybacteria bacterium]